MYVSWVVYQPAKMDESAMICDAERFDAYHYYDPLDDARFRSQTKKQENH